MVGGGTRRQRRDGLETCAEGGEAMEVKQKTKLLDVARHKIMAWMESGGSGIRHAEAEGDR